MKYKIMDGNEACSYVSYNFTEVAGIYPITPASPMAEYVDKYASGDKKNFWGNKVEVVEMQSEAGAIAMVHGALLNGMLASTYTASQGLLLMLPNMYKIAGELLPCVVNVAARTVATHALSIFGDHSDVYAARTTGFAMLASSSVQQVMDLTSVAYLSTIEGRIPFINFFDGFRTSHELQKVELLDMDKIKPLIDEDRLKEFKDKTISNNNVTRGTNQNDDIYFQIAEARNKYYDQLPDIVNTYMKEISTITKREYKPFNYYGDKNATRVIVAMGSVCETIKEVIDNLNNNNEAVGLIEVHLYRPFSVKYLLDVLPKTVSRIAVLDRTKESGGVEPLYLDVVNALREERSNIKVVGGRYGLSSKNTTPYQIKAVFDFLKSQNIFNGFTIGITDDVTKLSLKDAYFPMKKDNFEILIYGFGSDGMVSASKDIIKITGENTKAFPQGYFEYDSKKSGGLTRCHLRFGDKTIRSTYYVSNPDLVVCTKDNYLNRFNMLENIEANGIFLINTTKSKEELFKCISTRDKDIIRNKNIRFYMVDATSIAYDLGLGNKINTIMETIIFKLSKIISFKFAKDSIKSNLEVILSNKGNEVIEKNKKAIDRALESLVLINNDEIGSKGAALKEKNLFDMLDAKMGDRLKVSQLERFVDGSFDGGQSCLEKKNYTDMLPCYNKEKCIMCNQCSFVCPHGVIRPFLLNDEELEDAPEELLKDLKDANLKDQDLKFTIGINLNNCTGCGLCSKVCPGKRGEKAITMKTKDSVRNRESLNNNKYLFTEVVEKKVMDTSTVKGSQFVKPKFEFSGACAGCGETPYIKLLTQLFGNELVIANATGCSSIYGGSVPSTPYSVPWANSLFEDNAEFGFGMAVADRIRKEKIRKVIEDNIHLVPDKYKEIFASYYKRGSYESSLLLYEVIDDVNIKDLLPLKEYVKPKSFWMIGGDGWAYDIGFGGLDHVLSTNENVNILVLDTEVYSNTGGQSSKSSKVGSVAKFSAKGKHNNKKDLAKIALTYPHVYVATVSLGANMMQTIKAFNEAKNHNGPSIIIAYAPCIAQGIKGGMSNSIEEEKKATFSGYFPLFRYNPETKEFSLDSKADFDKYYEFLENESRYTSLKKVNKEEYESLFEKNKQNAMDRYEYYEKLRDMYKKDDE